MPTVKDALDIINKLTVPEQESLKTMLLSPTFVKTLDIEEFVTKESFSNRRVCPLCGCIHVVRNGHRKGGTQRYICRNCGKSFGIATNSIVSGTRKELAVWEKYIDCMMNGLSIRKTAIACGIHRNTAFIWRHKILDTLQNMEEEVKLDGRIETDSTLVTDRMNFYVRFTNADGIELVQLKTGKAKKGIYNIQHINNYHSQLKRFMRRFNGVSTKYLNNYLVWTNLVNHAKENDTEKRSNPYLIKCRNVLLL